MNASSVILGCGKDMWTDENSLQHTTTIYLTQPIVDLAEKAFLDYPMASLKAVS